MDIYRRHKLLCIFGGVPVIAVVAFVVSNKVGPVGSGWWGHVNETEGVAIRGYDTDPPVHGRPRSLTIGTPGTSHPKSTANFSRPIQRNMP